MTPAEAEEAGKKPLQVNNTPFPSKILLQRRIPRRCPGCLHFPGLHRAFGIGGGMRCTIVRRAHSPRGETESQHALADRKTHGVEIAVVTQSGPASKS
jgi:hypothetical protein